MGGRGGRGGRGGKPVSNARLLLERSAAEAGLDSSNLRALHDIAHNGLYMDLQWHSSGRGLWIPADEPESTAPQALPIAISGTEGEAIDMDVKPEPVDEKQTKQQQAQQQQAPHIPETNRTMTAITAPSTTTLSRTKRLPVVTYMTNKQRELIAKWQASGHYVRPSQQVDVVRYGNYYKSNRLARSVVQAVLNAMRSGAGHGVTGAGTAPTNTRNKLALDEQYVPSELIQTSTIAAGRMKSISGKKSAKALERLAENERTGGGNAAANAGDEEGGDEFDDDVLEEPAEEEDGEDYTTNHYNSDDDDGGDDGGDEPTF
jgi:hypothetical protein